MVTQTNGGAAPAREFRTDREKLIELETRLNDAYRLFEAAEAVVQQSSELQMLSGDFEIYRIVLERAKDEVDYGLRVICA